VDDERQKDLDRAFALAARREEPGNREQAVALLERLIRSGADFPRLRFLLASLYDDHTEDLGKALEHYRAGLRLDPTDAAARNNLAVALLGLGHADEAAEVLIETVAENLDYGLAVQNLARLLLDLPDRKLRSAISSLAHRAGTATEVWVRLTRAMADAGREGALEAVYSKGHALKNLVGLAGARAQTLARRVGDRVGPEVAKDLGDLAKVIERIYADWAAYLKTARAQGSRREDCDLNRVVRDVVISFPPSDRPQVRLDESAPHVTGDPAALREAIFNLAKNAREAAPTGKVSIEIGVADEGRAARVAVSDDGPGIDAGNLRRIFSPGFTTKPNGSGFGLSVAERVATALGGRIDVESRPGHGATFSLLIPAGGPPEPAAAPRLKPEEFVR
jgi:signal transduction histidine kinase